MVTEVYKFGEFSIDLVLRRVYRSDEVIPLTSKSFEILKLLVQRNGQVVTKEELMRRVWPKQFIEEGNLSVRISALRKALAENPQNRFIETVSGRGYRFVARVRAESRVNSIEVDKAFGSLAVLPFIAEGHQQKLRYISEGVVESLINSLSQVPQLKVIARSTVFRYLGEDKYPQEIAEELGVEALVAGRIGQVNNNLFISVELINAADGTAIWGARYERDFSDLVTLQDKISKELLAILRIKLTRVKKGNSVTHSTGSSEAYHLYLKGRYYYNNKRSVQGIQKAVSFFKRALKTDPEYACAYSGIADCYITTSYYGLSQPKSVMPKARAAVLKALEIDGSLGQAHASLGTIKSNYEWDWDGAKKHYERALELNPSDAHTRHAYGNYLSKVGQMEQAIGELKKAKELDPLSLNVNVGLAKVYYLARDYKAAIRQCFETLEIEPEFAPACGVLGLIYLQQGQYDAAAAEIKKVITFSSGDYTASAKSVEQPGKQNILESDPEAVALLAQAYTLDGKLREARRILSGLIKMSQARYVEPHTIAIVYIGLGDNAKAFEWLEKAFKDRSTTLTYIKVWPLIDPLRSEPQYRDLVTRMGLEA